MEILATVAVAAGDTAFGAVLLVAEYIQVEELVVLGTDSAAAAAPEAVWVVVTDTAVGDTLVVVLDGTAEAVLVVAGVVVVVDGDKPVAGAVVAGVADKHVAVVAGVLNTMGVVVNWFVFVVAVVVLHVVATSELE